MNGRIYDPQIGRFLSADVIIDGADSLQGYNRYSYVHNNPLALVDPDGNCATSFASFQRNMGMPDKEVAKETFKSGAESIPGVGEISDLAVLTGSNSTPRERLIAGGSLALNIATAGFAPNFGRKANSVVDAVEEGMEASSDAAKSAARKADGTIPNSSNLDQNAPTSGSRPEVDTNAGPAGDATNVDGGKTYQTYTKTNPETGEE